MRPRRQPPRIPEVASLLETSTDYGRGLLRGILRYARLHGPWPLYLAPGHLDQTMVQAKTWNVSGIIARIRSPEMERMILATRIPCVVSSLIGSWTRMKGANFGQIRSNHKEIARMGSAHLHETGLRRFAFCGFASLRWSRLREEAFIHFARERDSPARRITLTWRTGSSGPIGSPIGSLRNRSSLNGCGVFRSQWA